MNTSLLRIIDANFNRLREGLRVCEDITRFSMQDSNITKTLKDLRHKATATIVTSRKLPQGKLVDARDIKSDSEKFTDFKKGKKADLIDLFMANLERVKESLRVLEECSKIIDEALSEKLRKLRFSTYELEKKFIKKIGNISSSRYWVSKK